MVILGHGRHPRQSGRGWGDDGRRWGEGWWEGTVDVGQAGGGGAARFSCAQGGRRRLLRLKQIEDFILQSSVSFLEAHRYRRGFGLPTVCAE